VMIGKPGLHYTMDQPQGFLGLEIP